MTSLSISVKRCSSVQCIFISSQTKKQLVVPVMLRWGVGRRGHTQHMHIFLHNVLSIQYNNTKNTWWGGRAACMGSAPAFISSLFINHMLNFWDVQGNGYLPPPTREEGDFRDFNNVRPLLSALKWSQTSRLIFFHLISPAGNLRHTGIALAEAMNEERSVLQWPLFIFFFKEKFRWESSPSCSKLWNALQS